jgi:hypothetical protein
MTWATCLPLRERETRVERGFLPMRAVLIRLAAAQGALIG